VGVGGAELLGESSGERLQRDAADGAALHFAGEKLNEVVTSRADARAFRMRRTDAGRIERRALPTRFLGAAPLRLAA